MRTERPIRRRTERGLTLIELIVTVAILAILAAAAVPVAIAMALGAGRAGTAGATIPKILRSKEKQTWQQVKWICSAG